MLNIEIRGFRGVDRADIGLSPLALIAGTNGAGKTSIIQAVQAALTSDHLPLAGATKKGAEVLVRRGAEEGSVKIEDTGNSVTLTWPKCKTMVSGNAPKATRFAAGLSHILDLKDKERAAALSAYVHSAPSKEEVIEELTDAGFPAEGAEKVWIALSDPAKGWDVCHQKARDNGTTLKANWEGVTGEKYGTEKASTWTPAGWNEEIAATTAEMLSENVTASKEALEKVIGQAAVSAAEIDSLKAQAAEPAPNLQALTEGLDALKKQHGEAKVKRAALVPADPENALLCPHCETPLLVDTPWTGKHILKLAPKTKGTAAEIKKQGAQIAELDGEIARLAGSILAQETKVSDANYATRKIAAAKARLDTIAATGTTDAAQVAEVRAAHALDAERLKAKLDKEKADQIHASFLRNEKLIAILAPDGLRKKKLVAALADFNARLADLSKKADWPAVRLDENLEAHYGTEPYWLASESQQYRVRVTIQVLMGILDKSAALVIDRADMLDQKGRNGLFVLLHQVGTPALVACTMNGPDKVPDLAKAGWGRSYWVSEGRATPVGSAEQKAA